MTAPKENYNNRVTITSLAILEEQMREFTKNLTYEERFEYLQKLIHITHGPGLSKQEKYFNTCRVNINKQHEDF